MSLAYPLPKSTRQAPDMLGDGVTLAFPFAFRAMDETDLIVLTRAAADGVFGAPRTLGVDYTVTGVGVAAGGAVVFAAAPAAGVVVRIVGHRTPSRLNSVIASGRVNAQGLEDELDTLEATAQELRRDVDAALDSQALPLAPSAAGPLAARATYDDAAAAFIFLQTDDAQQRLVYYVKTSAAHAAWSGPLIATGPAGAAGAPGGPGGAGPAGGPPVVLTVTSSSIDGAGVTTYNMTGAITTPLAVGQFFSTVLDQPNGGNVVFAITPTGGGATVNVSVLAQSGANIPKNFLKAAPYRYAFQTHSSTVMKQLGAEPAPWLSQVSLARAGVVGASVSLSANNEFVVMMDDGTGALAEIARLDRATRALRLAAGRFLMGATAGAAVEVYSQYNRQPFIDNDPNWTAALRQMRSGVLQTLEDINPVSKTDVRPRYLSAGDHFCIERATVAGAFYDCRLLPVGGMFHVKATRGGATSAILYAPVNWGGYAGNQLTFAAGARLIVERTADTEFDCYILSGAAPTVATATRPIAAKSFLITGQSKGAAIATRGALAGFQSAMATLGVVDDINWINAASGESGLTEYEVAVGSTNYWWNLAGDVPGPLLTAAIAAGQAAVDAGQPAPSLVIWDQGDKTAPFVTPGPLTPAVIQSAQEKIFAALRAAAWAPGVLQICIMPQASADTLAYERQYSAVREMHLRVGAQTNNFVGPATYDIARTYQNVHPSFFGMRVYGERLALWLANYVWGQANFLGPYVSGVTEVNPTTFDVTVEADPASASLDGDDNPVPTDGWRLCSNANAVDAVYYPIDNIAHFSLGGSSHRFRITATAPCSGAQVMTHYGALTLVNRTGRFIAQTISPPALSAPLPLQHFNRGFT